jgi:hypothetical protein
MTSSPGKFEGEPEYVPDFWAKAMEGLADTREDGVFSFTITEDDAQKYPELVAGQRLLLSESTDGFVFSRVVKCKLPDPLQGRRPKI